MMDGDDDEYEDDEDDNVDVCWRNLWHKHFRETENREIWTGQTTDYLFQIHENLSKMDAPLGKSGKYGDKTKITSKSTLHFEVVQWRIFLSLNFFLNFVPEILLD